MRRKRRWQSGTLTGPLDDAMSRIMREQAAIVAGDKRSLWLGVNAQRHKLFVEFCRNFHRPRLIALAENRSHAALLPARHVPPCQTARLRNAQAHHVEKPQQRAAAWAFFHINERGNLLLRQNALVQAVTLPVQSEGLPYVPGQHLRLRAERDKRFGSGHRQAARRGCASQTVRPVLQVWQRHVSQWLPRMSEETQRNALIGATCVFRLAVQPRSDEHFVSRRWTAFLRGLNRHSGSISTNHLKCLDLWLLFPLKNPRDNINYLAGFMGHLRVILHIAL
ncbi:hypothetical protein AtDm6_3148 [Acetobacter tropicalis]|uniref:Uncharacterized protein n=1 Tax=Acetobacter tropicalis TaxID=104102 RepID=A0A095AWL2_9PROT|nr:hypothetical protein AtDm6_3148 [Acetobacter tropicalis]